jgi:phosphocarrier protein HPr
LKELNVTVVNKLGLHARPAAMLVRKVMTFEAEVFLEKDGDRVSGKSIMGIMGFAACQGTEVKLIASGEDEDEALTELADLFKNKFGEE